MKSAFSRLLCQMPFDKRNIKQGVMIMIDKKYIRNRLDSIMQVMSGLHLLNENLEQEYHRIAEEIDRYSFRILMTGGFSSGKSTFLNLLLDRDLLKVNQTPETAIATELVYGPQEYLEAVDNQGNTQTFPLDCDTVFLPKDWRYLVFHVTADFLRENPDIVLVDMPGLDSDVEWHNKAIAQYIARGSAFLLFVSCEDGTLRKSVGDFLQEVASYPQSVSCFISKCDLRPAQQVEEACQQVSRDIVRLYQEPVPLETIAYDDPDFQAKAQKALLGFNAQMLFEKKFSGEIAAFIALCRAVVQTAKMSQQLDVSDLDSKIEELTQNEKKLIDEFDQQKAEIKRKYMQSVLPAIREDLEQALMMQVDQLTNALTVSPEAFNAVANRVIRTVLYKSTQQHVEESFDEFVNQLDLSFLENQDNAALKEALTQGLHLIASDLEGLRQSSAEKAKAEGNFKRAYQGIASVLAIATDVVNPLIELLIVFLPTILDLFSGLGRQARYDDLRNKVQSSVIPQILEKLDPEIEDAVCKIRDAGLAELENKTKRVLDTQRATLQDRKKQKEQREKTFENGLKMYDDALHALDSYIM